MDNQKHEQVGHAQKARYEPPKATFVPLKLEVRILTCSVKIWTGAYGSGESGCSMVGNKNS